MGHPHVKRDGSVYVFGDYKLNANDVLKIECTLSHALITCLSHCQDVEVRSSTYIYTNVSPSFQRVTAISCYGHPKGLHAYKLRFGVSSTPAIFQCIMDNLLPSVCTEVNDILITGKTMEDHLDHLESVLTCLYTRIRDEVEERKMPVLMYKVEYLGHVISSKGLEPSSSKVASIGNAPTSHNVTEIRSLLGIGELLWKVPLAPLYKLSQNRTSLLCQHNLEHDRCQKASSISLAYWTK